MVPHFNNGESEFADSWKHNSVVCTQMSQLVCLWHVQPASVTKIESRFLPNFPLSTSRKQSTRAPQQLCQHLVRRNPLFYFFQQYFTVFLGTTPWSRIWHMIRHHFVSEILIFEPVFGYFPWTFSGKTRLRSRKDPQIIDPDSRTTLVSSSLPFHQWSWSSLWCNC